MKTTIVLADDHRIVRDGLRSLIGKQPAMEVIGEADNGQEAVELARKLKPDVVVMDIAMPDLNGIEATRRIKKEAPDVKVLALSMHSDKRFVSGMLAAGASGFLLKSCAFEDLTEAIQSVLAGHLYTSPAITEIVVEEYAQQVSRGEPAGETGLTDREREVLQLLAEGKSAKDIAQRLHVSTKTVDAHRHNIMARLGIHNLADLTKYAIRKGLTSL